MPEIQLRTLLDAYRYLMEVYWLPTDQAPSLQLQNSCMQAAVEIKVAIGGDRVSILDPDASKIE